jgi:cardiolipin synthase
MQGTGGSPAGSSAILTIPNALSALRIAMIPVFVPLIIHRGTEAGGILVFAAVVATDWVDGFVARRIEQVSEFGKVLDPVADRLAIAAGLVALVVRHAFPAWAAGLILGRDVAVLLVGGVLLARRRLRIDVRPLGKIATFSLMVAIPFVSWGNLDLASGAPILVVGWILFAGGIVASYAAAALYLGDIRRSIAGAAAAAPPGVSFGRQGPADRGGGGGVP